MIQRIQSIYLLAVASVAFILIWVDPIYAVFQSDTGLEIGLSFCNNGSFTANKTLYTPELLSLGILISVGMIALINVFLYRNRILQMRITKIAGILVIVFWLVLLVRFFMVSRQYSDQYNLGFQIIWPLILLLPVIMAYFAIRRDEDLISSMDRIR